ncbi:MAG: YebC/PmpR family DNA-binding transcriptional regulator [Pseudomonadota bacterium]
MAGHSKWANIQHRKKGQDAKRGKLFTKFIREITVAARMGGPDESANPRLRAVVEKALRANMTRDTVGRAVKRGAGTDDGSNFDEIRYEGYGPVGVAIMVDCLTDNKNRTVAEVRHAFSKAGGSLGTDGSVSYLFSKIGVISFPAGSDEEAIMEAALDVGADDVETNDDGSIDVTTDDATFMTVKDAMATAGFEAEMAEITMTASTSVDLSLDDAQKVIRIVDMLEDLDDVQNVYSNAEFSDDVMAQLSEL